MFSVFVIAALAAAATATPLKSRSVFPHGRIIGGDNAVIETFPYQVSLQFKDRHICGASIINSHWILTAGHCIIGQARYYSVRAGSTYQRSGGSTHKVEKIIRHENYYTSQYGVPFFDIAVIKVKTPFEFDDTRQPIELYNLKEQANDGEATVITGWGSTGEFSSPDQLQTVSVPIITKKLCIEAYKSFDGIPEGQICAAYYGEGGKDACQGDSGGPLAINGRLAGVVSWGNGCAAAYYPGVYTEVAHYREWINKHIES